MSYSFSIKSSHPFVNSGPAVEEPVSTSSETSDDTTSSTSSTSSTSGTTTSTTSTTNLASSSRRQVSNTGLSIRTTATAVEDYY